MTERTEQQSEQRTFYDTHMHAFNLSHPYFYVFIRRFKLKAWKLVLLAWVISLLLSLYFLLTKIRIRILSRFLKFTIRRIERKIEGIKNLLSVMENDIGSYFLIIENCLREPSNPLLQEDGLHIGNTNYQRIVLTPLMMDFGYKGKTNPKKGKRKKRFHYDVHAAKPITQQVIDLFNGIQKYKETYNSSELEDKLPGLTSNTNRQLEIYPFLGINPRNYEPDEIDELLNDHFSEYKHSIADLEKNLGKFDGDVDKLGSKFNGDVDKLGSNFFAGIKVYPPLGFNPWPEDKNEDPQELHKAKKLYQYCSEKRIPLISHGGTGGFVVLKGKRLRRYASIEKWQQVLDNYPALKLCLAHLPMPCKAAVANPLSLRKKYLKLVIDNENVYVDFSCRAVTDNYYARLRKTIERLSPEEQRKLKTRILFGSDFPVNLTHIDSYNSYLNLFSKTTSLSEEEKFAFCCSNPERFLFS